MKLQKIERKTAQVWVDRALRAVNNGNGEPVPSPEKIIMGRDNKVTLSWPRWIDPSPVAAALIEIAASAGYEVATQYSDRDGYTFGVVLHDPDFEGALLTIETDFYDRDLAALATEVGGPFVYAIEANGVNRFNWYNQRAEGLTLDGNIVLYIDSETVYATKNGERAETSFYRVYAVIGDGLNPTPKAIVEIAPHTKLARVALATPFALNVNHFSYDSVAVYFKFYLGEDRNGRRYAEHTIYVRRDFKYSREDRGGKFTAWAPEINWSAYGATPTGATRNFAAALNDAAAIGDQWADALNSPAFFVAGTLRRWRVELD